MQKQLQKTLSQITMYSKMGRYISSKILKYNKKATTHRNYTKGCPPPEEYLRVKPLQQDKNLRPPKYQRNSDEMYMTQPPVGYYKINHAQIQKNVKTYNFDRSVPHFFRQKFHCHETKPVSKDYPDLSTSKPQIKGRVELRRTPGRNDIKGSVRKTNQNPHQRRFQLINDHKGIENGKKSINMQKSLERDNRMFKNAEFAPEYSLKRDHNLCRLDTHLIPFEGVSPRNQNHMILKSGISDFFNQAETTTDRKAVNWKMALPREKIGVLPSYMDKNINTRSSITLLNLKSLEMNSSNLKKLPEKVPKITRKPMQFIEQRMNKQNHLRNSIH